MAVVQYLPAAKLRRRTDARPRDEAAIASLRESIDEVGQLEPILVRPVGGEFEVIAGSHRLAVFEAIEIETGEPQDVLCMFAEYDDDLRAELAMLDENLMRAELSTAERAKALGRRKAIYEELHPETRHGGDRRSDQVANVATRNFAQATAAATGTSDRAVRRDAERGEKISPEALDVVSGTHRDTGKYLDELKAVPREQQVEKAKRDVAAAKPDRSARAPAALYKKADADVAKPDVDPFATWIELTEGTATLTAKAIFEACPVRSRPTLSQRCEAIRVLIDGLDDLIEQPHSRGAAA